MSRKNHEKAPVPGTGTMAGRGLGTREAKNTVKIEPIRNPLLSRLGPTPPLSQKEIAACQEFFKNTSKRATLLPIGYDPNNDEVNEIF